ncbi:myosin heavy chain, striated muscle-like, partial [Clarias magur]
KQLRAGGVSFSQEASDHLSKIAEAIKELETCRKAVHEELEVETIETGKLRHQLMSQHDNIITEISAAVSAARDANAAELNQLQMEVVNIMQEVESMEKRQKLLEEQNVLLLPEQQLLNAAYIEVIKQLNSQLSEKADTQITLNETRNEIQSTREKIAQVHSARKDLQDNLIREKKIFKETKEMLEKQINEMLNAIQKQTKTNTEMHQELGVALAQLQKKEERADSLSDQISLLDRSMVRLKASQQKYEEQIKDGNLKSCELTKQKELREKELQELRETLNLQLFSLQENIRTVEREIEEEQKENSIRFEAISQISSFFRVQKEKEDNAMADHSSLNRELEKSKQRLDERFTSIAKYKLKIKEMEEEMKQLNEANRVTVKLFQKNLVDLEGRLEKEKNSRAALELDREELCVQIETLKEQHDDSIRKLCSATAIHKTRYSELAKEKLELQEHEAMSSLIAELTQQIATTEDECKQRENKYSEEIKQLNMEADSVARAQREQVKELKDQESVLSKVEALFEVEHSRNQALKQQTTDLETRKSHLELSMREVKERTAATLRTREDLKKELQTLREDHMELLSTQAEQIRAIERSVYEKGLMLEQVNMENSRLRLCIEQMKEDIVNARKEKETHTQEMCWMKEEVQSIYIRLVEAWITDKLATE